MPPRPPYVERLAAMRHGSAYARDPRDRPRVVYAEDDYGTTRLEVPGPRPLARALVLPYLRLGRLRGAATVEVLNHDRRLAVRPSGSTEEPRPLPDLDKVTDDLVDVLTALPDVGTAETYYRNLRRLVRLDCAQARALVAEAVAVAHTLAREYKRPKPPREPRPSVARPVGERVAAHRRRERDAEAATARVWLRGYLSGWDDPEAAPEPGTRVLAADLYAQAVEALEEWADAEEPLDEDVDESPLARVPRRRVFYEVADEILGARTRSGNSAAAYTIPAPPAEPEEADPMDPMTEAVLTRTAEILADRQEQRLTRLQAGDRVGALTMQAQDHAATGTDGAVVDLVAARARRSR